MTPQDPWSAPLFCSECGGKSELELTPNPSPLRKRFGHAACRECGALFTTEIKPGNKRPSLGYILLGPKEGRP